MSSSDHEGSPELLPPYSMQTELDVVMHFQNRGFQQDDVTSIGQKPSNQVEMEEESQKPRERMRFGNQLDFLMSCISMSVGLGNVWRFPVTAFNNGGGAFLIPYLIVLVLVARPVYFLELTLGQFSSYGQVKCWKLAPFFKGVGYASMFATSAVTSYYVFIIALSVYYFFLSFQSTLPWTVCDESWAGEGNCNSNGTTATNMSTPEMFYLNKVLKQAPNIDNGIGNPDWKLALCLVFAWVVIFGSLIRGVRSSGKVAYVTAILPYAVMIILLIRGLTLDGSVDGILYFIKPDFSKLLKPGVWYAAITQVFFSLNTGFGSIIMFSSHNPFNHNIYRDSWIIASIDTLTSLLAGLTVFSVLGGLAASLNVDISKVVTSGEALAFVTYPEAISQIGGAPQIFGVLFFAMLFALGLGSSISDAGAVVTVICDRYPKLVRWQVTLAVSLILCSIGFVYTTPGGQFILAITDFYAGTFIVFITTILELVGIAWVYGIYNYLNDVEFMLNIRLGWYWKICWGVIIPVFLTIILIYSLTEGLTPSLINEVPYPTTALVFGWLVAIIPLMSLPAGGIQAMTKIPGTLWDKFIGANKPSSDWGPMNPKDRMEWESFKQSCLEMTLLERIKKREL